MAPKIILRTLLAIAVLGCRPVSAQQTVAEPPAAQSTSQIRDIIRSAFVETHDGWSVDEVILNDELNDAFIKRCRTELPKLDPADVTWRLLNMRKAGLLKVKTTRFNRTSVTSSIPVAEIVARNMIDQHQISIDKILATPALRQSFDSAALAIDADADAYSVRKAALQLRKQRRLKPELIARIADWGRDIIELPLEQVRKDPQAVPALPGIYIFRDQTGYLYIGQSENLQQRLKEHLDASSNFSLGEYLADQKHDNVTIELHAFAADSRAKETMIRRAYESELIASRKPKFNIQP